MVVEIVIYSVQMKKQQVYIFSGLAFCIILFALLINDNILKRSLPETPVEAFRIMTNAMINEDKQTLRQISEEGMVEKLEYWQGNRATELTTYDFLIAKGVKSDALIKPWGLWRNWAKQVDFQKVKSVPKDAEGNNVWIDTGKGGQDGGPFYFSREGNGWVLQGYGITAGSHWNNNWKQDEQ